MTTEISASLARRLAITSQGLGEPWDLPTGAGGATEIIDRLGYVQIDTISVIVRAHHHVIWSRHGGYEPDMIYDLLKKREIFEFWAHAASYLPISDYRFYLPAMANYARRGRTREWMRDNRKIVKTVLDRIESEGPLSSADFKTPKGSRGTWWNWKPAKRALEVLLGSGKLMVSERRKFQRLYDLTERVLPGHVDTSVPTDGEVGRFVVRRVLEAQGISNDLPMLRWSFNRNVVRAVIDEMLEEGEIERVSVEGSKADYLALTRTIDEMPLGDLTKRIHILSPFDNMTIWRNRLRQLFNFEYSLECYRRPEDRVYGYFCLPILWGDRFVGRLDSKAERRSRVFRLVNLALERDLGDYDEFIPHLVSKISDFARFNSCEMIELDRIEPRSARTRFEEELGNAVG
jgi:uncharacterized protein YcaQ